MKFKIAIAAVCTVLAVSAADVWKNADFTQWSAEDAKKVLTKSPWAKEALVTMAMPSNGSGGGGGSRRGGGGGMGGGGGEMGGGGMGAGGGRGGMGGGEMGEGGGGGTAPAMKLTIRWESAVPVKAAEMKVQYGDSMPAKGDKGYTIDQAQDSYVISVTGLRTGGGRGRRQGGSDDAASGGDQRSSADRMKDTLMSSTQLFRKGKDPIAPLDVKMNTTTNVVVFVFPKTDAISDDDKEVEFRTMVGRVQVKEKFSLKDMHFAGKLEL